MRRVQVCDPFVGCGWLLLSHARVLVREQRCCGWNKSWWVCIASASVWWVRVVGSPHAMRASAARMKGTRMPFSGLAAARDIEDVIAFLIHQR